MYDLFINLWVIGWKTTTAINATCKILQLISTLIVKFSLNDAWYERIYVYVWLDVMVVVQETCVFLKTTIYFYLHNWYWLLTQNCKKNSCYWNISYVLRTFIQTDIVKCKDDLMIWSIIDMLWTDASRIHRQKWIEVL